MGGGGQVCRVRADQNNCFEATQTSGGQVRKHHRAFYALIAEGRRFQLLVKPLAPFIQAKCAIVRLGFGLQPCE